MAGSHVHVWCSFDITWKRGADAPPGAGGTLSEDVNQPLIQDADYSIFAGIELTLAYDWPGCPDDAPYGPVTLGTTPVVRAHAPDGHRRAAALISAVDVLKEKHTAARQGRAAL